MTKIRLSAGHGKGKEFNRGGVLFNEGDQNLIMTDKLKNFLDQNYNVDIKEIRREKGNVDHSLRTRSLYGAGADLFYSWHTNAANGDARGVEVILSYQALGYRKFAEELCRTISKVLDTSNRGVKFRDNANWSKGFDSNPNRNKVNGYGELRGNKAKCAVIVEHCFHDNEREASKYLQRADKLIKEISEVIAKHFDLKRKETSNLSAKPKITNGSKLYKVTVPVLNIRSGAGTNYKIAGSVTKNEIYTITETKGNWGKLKSGAGWIYLGYTEKVEPKKGYSKKTNIEIAKEVLHGKWGNGATRQRKLKAAGFDPDAIQKIVNDLARGKI